MNSLNQGIFVINVYNNTKTSTEVSNSRNTINKIPCKTSQNMICQGEINSEINISNNSMNNTANAASYQISNRIFAEKTESVKSLFEKLQGIIKF